MIQYISLLILGTTLLAAAIVITWSRKRVATVDPISPIIETVVRPPLAPAADPAKEQSFRQQLAKDYKLCAADHNKLLRQYQLVKDKASPRGQALHRRLMEKQSYLQRFQAAIKAKYPNTKFA